MTIEDSVALIAGVPLVSIVPALVELAKRQGMPVRYAGLAAIVVATGLLILAKIALGEDATPGAVAGWLLGGIVYGLAAAGLHSQRKMLKPPPAPHSGKGQSVGDKATLPH